LNVFIIRGHSWANTIQYDVESLAWTETLIVCKQNVKNIKEESKTNDRKAK